MESRLREYGYLKDEDSYDFIQERVGYALNWVNDFKAMEEIEIELDKQQKTAVKALIAKLETAKDVDAIQSAIFESARDSEVKPRDFFKILYQILLNTDRGPKLGPYIHTIGNKHVIKLLKKQL
jgi:lysyl-tRNA synthetase class 1